VEGKGREGKGGKVGREGKGRQARRRKEKMETREGERKTLWICPPPWKNILPTPLVAV